MKFTICLHNGEDRNEVNQTMERLKPLSERHEVLWNNRIDRHPYKYDSYSELINDSVVSSETERVILINDRAVPTVEDIEVINDKLNNGFAWASRYAWGNWGMDKELFRNFGYLDEGFIGAGNEDDDYVLRLRIADVAIYESCESHYRYEKKISDLRPEEGKKCSISGPYFWNKWKNYRDAMVKIIPEPEYHHYNSLIGSPRPDIRNSWKNWSHSILGVGFGRLPQQGESRTYHFMKNGVEFKAVIDSTKD